jgi:hypothetical protein
VEDQAIRSGRYTLTDIGNVAHTNSLNKWPGYYTRPSGMSVVSIWRRI